jgi:glycosyltransferase involved in cell wall biosynthesis
MSRPTSVSVVINTLNRADSLARTLASLRQLTFPRVEVVVVDGPSTDGTGELLDRWGASIKRRACPEPNLSMSRNIGIAAASGDVVAFIDDDGIPEPTWLDELIDLYDSDDVGGAGGVVFDHTGATYQCRFNSCNRLGEASIDHDEPLDERWCFPGSMRFPYLIGTNSSFRRSALIEVGGFDEEYEYYLDETDVCLRLVDAGYLLVQSPGAPVHHKFLPSGVRNAGRVVVDNFSVVKNRIYFSLVNRPDEIPLTEVMRSNAEWAQSRLNDLRMHANRGAVTVDELVAGTRRVDEAWEVGLKAGFAGRKRLLDVPRLRQDDAEFQPFETIRPVGDRMRLCFVSQTLPPEQPGGIGRYFLDLARALAVRGHEVRIVTTRSDEHDTVDLEQGVWVHRIAKDLRPEIPRPEVPGLAELPGRIWANASAVAAEVRRMQRERPLDAVYAAMWDTETIGLLADDDPPLVTALVTTMGITLRTRPEWRDDPQFMAALGDPLLQLERHLIDRSDAIHALSDAVVDAVEATSGTEVDRNRLTVAPLGVVDPGAAPPSDDPGGGPTEVLFVGRFEKRKGIDLLLDAIADVLGRREDVRVTLVGRDDLPGEDGVPYRQVFEERHADADWLPRVRFLGEVDEDELARAYRECDIFVAPSRFESFGLIFLEAMAAGRPVVALAAGAAPEVVDHAVTGLLVEPEAARIAHAIESLVDDPALRVAMGAAGRARFEQRFTDDRMAESAEALFESVVARSRPQASERTA